MRPSAAKPDSRRDPTGSRETQPRKVNTMTKTMSNAEWLAEGFYRFGTEDVLEWRFRCPACGNEATPREFRSLGEPTTLVTSQCVGLAARPLGGLPGVNCTYDAHEDGVAHPLGLWSVEDRGGQYIPAFPFADYVGGEPRRPSVPADAG